MKLLSRRPVRPLLAAAGIAGAVLASGCGVQISADSADQLDVIGDVTVTTEQCVDGSGGPSLRTDTDRGSEDPCDMLFDWGDIIGSLSAEERRRLAAEGRRHLERGISGENVQLLLAHQIPISSNAPASFTATGVIERDEEERGSDDGTRTIHYTESPSYTAELEEREPSGPDMRWVGYISDPQTAEGGDRPRWTTTVRFTLPKSEPGEPFRGPFPYRTVIGYRDTPVDPASDVDCENGFTHCQDDERGFPEEEPDRAARAVPAGALTRETRDLAVAPTGDQVTIPAGQTGQIPFVLRYAGKAEPTFQLAGGSSLAGATVTPAPATYTPADDGQAVVNVGVAVPAGAPSGPQSVELVASLPNGQRRSATAQFTVGPAATSPIIVAAPSKRACVSRRSFTIRLRQTRRDPLVSATVTVNGKKVKTVKKGRITAPVRLAGLPKGTFDVKITARTRSGKTKTGTRRYRTCVPKRRGGVPKL